MTGSIQYFPLYYNEDTLCGDEICHDTGWENCDENRCIEMDHRRSSKSGSTAYASSVYGDHGGIGTVLADDPMLNVRVEGWKSPIRILCDSGLRIPLDGQIVKSAGKYGQLWLMQIRKIQKRKERDYMKWELRRSAVRMKTIRWILKN